MSSFMFHGHRRRFNHTTIALACAGASCGVYAETAATPDVELATVVVTASRQGTALKSTPAAISKITQTQIQQKHATFVGQLLDQTPGVHVADLGNEQHNMSIRQPLSYGALYQYLEDGLSIRPVGLFNHNALYEMNLAGIGGIEVLRGPASSLYGSNAVGGAVNFLTRAPSLTPTAEIGVQGSSEGFYKLDTTLSNTFDTALGQQGVRLSAYASQRGDNWQEHTAADKQSITLRHDMNLSDSTQIKNILTYNHLYTDMNGSATPQDYATRPSYSNQTFTYREVDATRLSSQISHQWTADAKSQATIYYRNNRTLQNPSYLIFNTGPTTAVGRITDQRFQSYGLELQQSQQLGTVKLIGGLTLDHTPVTSTETNLAVQRDPATGRYSGFTTGSLRRDYQVDVDNQALFGQVEWAVIPTVHLVAGARADQIRYDYHNDLTPSSTTGAPSESRDYRKVSPKVGAIWNATPQLDLYANASQGFVPPEVSSQYGGSLVAPNLRAATFNNIDTGMRFASRDKRFSGEVTLYRLTGKDEQISYSIAPGLSEPRNAASTIHQGVEVGGRWLISPTYQQSVRLAGAFAHHEYDGYQASPTLDYSGKTMKSAPSVLANLEYQITPLAGLMLAAEANYVSHYWMNDANTIRYPGHTLLNLRANYRTGPWEIYGQILNLADKHYADIAASTYSGVGVYNPQAQDTYSVGAPRTFLLGVRYRMGE